MIKISKKMLQSDKIVHPVKMELNFMIFKERMVIDFNLKSLAKAKII